MPMRFCFWTGAIWLMWRPVCRGEQKNIDAKCLALHDVFFDGTHGLVANTRVSGWEFGIGAGGLLDRGVVLQASESGYVNQLALDQLIVGHCYVVRTASGKYAKFHITRLDRETPRLIIDWSFQADGSRQFDQ